MFAPVPFAGDQSNVFSGKFCSSKELSGRGTSLGGVLICILSNLREEFRPSRGDKPILSERLNFVTEALSVAIRLARAHLTPVRRQSYDHE